MDPIAVLHMPMHVRTRAEIANYIVGLYRYYLARAQQADGHTDVNPIEPDVPRDINEALAADCLRIAEVLVTAIRNVCESTPVCSATYLLRKAPCTDTVSWDAVRYSDEISRRGTEIDVDEEDELLDKYPPLCPVEQITDGDGLLPVIRGPAVIADRHGNILVWSLPDVLPWSQQVRSFNPPFPH